MEKYGVDAESEATKTAAEVATSETPACPSCHAPLKELSITGVPLCPRCGSKPFEGETAPK